MPALSAGISFLTKFKFSSKGIAFSERVTPYAHYSGIWLNELTPLRAAA